jgi:predicted metal-binding protein
LHEPAGGITARTEGAAQGGTKKLECLALGAGACGGCKTCAKKKGEPCRHPGRALLSLEACGIDAYQMGRLAGLPLSNGANTVSFLGVLLYHHKD